MRARLLVPALLIAAVALLNPSPDAGAQEIDTSLQCPTNVRAIPDSGSVTLLWDCADGNVVGYEYRMKSAGAGWGDWTDAGGRERRFHIVGGLVGNVGYAFQVRAKGTIRVDTTNTYEARRQFVTTMPEGNQATGAGTYNISAMPFRTGSNPDGYLITGARVMFYDFRDDADASNDEVNDDRTAVVKIRENRIVAEGQHKVDRPGSVLNTLTRVGSGPLRDLHDFSLTSDRKLEPNTIYWITVNEGVPCDVNNFLDSNLCSAPYLM